MGAPWFKDPPPSSSKRTLSWFQDVQRLNQPRVRRSTTFSGPQPDFARYYFRSPQSTRAPHAIVAESRKLKLSTLLKNGQYAFQDLLFSVPDSSIELDQTHHDMGLGISHYHHLDAVGTYLPAAILAESVPIQYAPINVGGFAKRPAALYS